MTVITYSSAAGSPAKGIPVRQHLSKSLGPWTMPHPSTCPRLEVCGVKGQTGIEERGSKREEEEERETWDGVIRRIGRNLSCREAGKGRVIWRTCLEREADTREILTAAETKGAIKQTEEDNGGSKTWPFSPVSFLLKKISEGGVKTGRKTMNRMHERVWLFVWFTLLLLFSLCPNMASSQV